MSTNIIPFAKPSDAPRAKPPKRKKETFLEHQAAAQWREVRPIKGARPHDKFFCCYICGDSLSGDGIYDRDYLVCRSTFKLSEVMHGHLAAVQTPCGLLVKHVYIGIKEVRLASSNPNFEDLYFTPDVVEIVGIVVRVERDF